MCQFRIAPLVKASLPSVRATLTIRPQLGPKHEILRSFGNDSRDRVTHAARRRTLKETILAPAGETAFGIGKGAVAGGAALGIGALCYYGLGLSNKSGAIDHAM